MGWWRTLLPCCGPGLGTFSCCCCVAKEGMHDEVLDQVTRGTKDNEDKSFVFLDNYPAQQKILNPAVPFLGELPVEFATGRIVVLLGTVQPNAIRMSVNLACGGGPTADLAFHLNPRFEQNLVVRNNRMHNRWGKEETSSAKRFPFKRAYQFQMQILATEDAFLVAFNGEHFCSFAYRVPISDVHFIQVNGDVDIIELEYKQVEEYPLPYAGIIKRRYIVSDTKSLSRISKKILETPVTAELKEGLPVGREIEVVGRVKLLPHSFYVNLQGGTQVWPHPLVALHINPRFRASGGVIQNSWIKGKWGAEVPAGNIHQFRAGRPFSIRIRCENDKYAVSVDGAPPVYFQHRCSPDIVNAIYIHGDVSVKDILYKKIALDSDVSVKQEDGVLVSSGDLKPSEAKEESPTSEDESPRPETSALEQESTSTESKKPSPPTPKGGRKKKVKIVTEEGKDS